MTDRFGGRLNELYSNSVSHFFCKVGKIRRWQNKSNCDTCQLQKGLILAWSEKSKIFLHNNWRQDFQVTQTFPYPPPSLFRFVWSKMNFTEFFLFWYGGTNHSTWSHSTVAKFLLNIMSSNLHYQNISLARKIDNAQSCIFWSKFFFVNMMYIGFLPVILEFKQ